MRRYKRKTIKRPTFALLRDKFAFTYNMRKNLPKLQLIQLKIKKRYRERTIRKNKMNKILNSITRNRQLETFKTIRLANPNIESLEKLTSVYRENVKYFDYKLSSLMFIQMLHKGKYLVIFLDR